MANTARLVIDPIARKISTKYEKIRLVQYDNNSMRITFEMPRYVRGHDMSNCSTCEVHYDNISADRKEKVSDVYIVDDIALAPEDDETINFSWLVSRAATQIVGSVEFSLHFGCSEDPSLEYAWHTTTYSGIVVLVGKHNTQQIIDAYPDALSSLLNEAKKYTDNAVKDFKGVEIVEGTGDRTDAVMSQKATTDALEGKVDKPEEGVEFIKSTDLATSTKAGVVKVQAVGGIKIVNEILQLDSANESEISSKRAINAPLKPNNIDSIVKVGITTNTKVLTDEEKQSAQNWLGVKSELDSIKAAVNGRLYDYVVDYSVSIAKSPPANAMRYAQLLELGDIIVYGNGVANEIGKNASSYFVNEYAPNLEVTYDVNTRIITLNGSCDASTIDIIVGDPVPFGSHDWRVTAEYIGGTVDGIEATMYCGVTTDDMSSHGAMIPTPLPKSGKETFSIGDTYQGNLIGYTIRLYSEGYTYTFDNYQLRISAGYEREIVRREVGQIVAYSSTGEVLNTYPPTAPQTLDLEGVDSIQFLEEDGSFINPAESTIMYQVKVVL